MIRCSFAFILILVSGFCFGQEYLIESRYYSVEEGLSSPVVNQITKDHRGFLWVATMFLKRSPIFTRLDAANMNPLSND